MGANASVFGALPDGSHVWRASLANESGVSADILTLGATIHSIKAPDRLGRVSDVILGKKDVDGYLDSRACSAAVIGRVANRIKGHRFPRHGKVIMLDANERKNTLHGGSGNYARRNFALVEADSSHAVLALRDHGEGGFPGEVDIQVTYSLNDDNELMVEYLALPTEDTPINITNHAYFNLAGHSAGRIDRHELYINANFYTPADREDIPTGEILRVKDTPFDFTRARPLGEAMDELAEYGDKHGGYDHNFVLNGSGWRVAAAAHDPKSGRYLEVFTDLPGLQLYTANFIEEGTPGKGKAIYGKHSGFCLETQYFPDSVHQPHFPDCVVWAGEIFETATAFRFSVK